MRFNVELLLNNERFPKDKNRIILSFLKHVYKLHNKDYYESLYEDEQNKRKSFTFSLYMPQCTFTREEIIIPDKKIILNFSTDEMKDGIFFYNAILANIGKPYQIRDITIKANRINMVNEKIIANDYAIFTTMSPIVVREHQGDNKKTWYYSLDDEKGRKIFIENVKYQLLDKFGEERRLDIEEIKFQVLKNKEVKVKHYGIEILSNICKLQIYAKPYLLDYLYKGGIGARKNSGFGMLNLV